MIATFVDKANRVRQLPVSTGNDQLPPTQLMVARDLVGVQIFLEGETPVNKYDRYRMVSGMPPVYVEV